MSSFRICDPGDSNIWCVSQNPEPKCKNPIANPSRYLGFDPDNCPSITGTNVQDALDQLCMANDQAIMGRSLIVQTVALTSGTSGTITLTTIDDRLGTDITISTPDNYIVIGDTGSYYISANFIVQFVSVVLGPTPDFNITLEQGNTGTFATNPCFFTGSAGLTSTQVSTISTQGMVCVSNLNATAGNNVFRFRVSSTGFEGTIGILPFATVQKISDTLCT